MSKLKLSICMIAGTLALTGCQTNQAGVTTPQGEVKPRLTPAPEPVKPTDPSNINGKWAPTNPKDKNTYYNEFKNGKFVARAPNDSATFAVGSYKTLKDGTIQMNWYSKAREAYASAKCKKLTASEMQCVDNKSVFNLKRI